MPHQIIGPGSLTKRPDAISSDYLIAHSFGPVQLGDNTQGALNRVWRVRSVAGSMFLDRQFSSTTYGAEVLLFSMGEPYPDEIDLAFDQNGQVIVVCQRATGVEGAPQIWLYWFNPIVGAFQFVSFGAGRTPRLLLDEGNVNASWSDVLLFYMSDTVGSLCYRQQRDRYLVEYPLAAMPALNSFVEDAYRSTDNRIHVLCSVRDVLAGTYILDHIESLLYPYDAGYDSATAGWQLLEGADLRTVQIQYAAETETFKAGLITLPSTLVSVVLEYFREHEDVKAAWELRAGSALLTIVILYPGDTREQESFKGGHQLIGGALPTVVFEYSRDAEAGTAGLLILGASFA